MNGYKIYKIPAPGAEVEHVAEIDGELRLGEEGRGRSVTIVPVVGTGAAYRAKKTETGIVLVAVAEVEKAPAPCLAVINYTGGYDRGRRYQIEKIDGTLVTITSGQVAWGEAGRLGGGGIALCMVEPKTEFMLRSKYANHWYHWDGYQWRVETPPQRAARIALLEVKNGGGEWL